MPTTVILDIPTLRPTNFARRTNTPFTKHRNVNSTSTSTYFIPSHLYPSIPSYVHLFLDRSRHPSTSPPPHVTATCHANTMIPMAMRPPISSHEISSIGSPMRSPSRNKSNHEPIQSTTQPDAGHIKPLSHRSNLLTRLG